MMDHDPMESSYRFSLRIQWEIHIEAYRQLKYFASVDDAKVIVSYVVDDDGHYVLKGFCADADALFESLILILL